MRIFSAINIYTTMTNPLLVSSNGMFIREELHSIAKRHNKKKIISKNTPIMNQQREKNYRHIMSELCELSDESIAKLVKNIEALKREEFNKAKAERYIEEKMFRKTTGKRKHIKVLKPLHAVEPIKVKIRKGTLEDLREFAKDFL